MNEVNEWLDLLWRVVGGLAACAMIVGVVTLVHWCWTLPDHPSE